MSPVLALVLLCQGPVRTAYFGVYYSGVKAGHAVATESPDTVSGKPATVRRSHVELMQVMAGVQVKGSLDDNIWFDADNHLLREDFVGRTTAGTTKANAVFGEKTVEVDFVKGGKKSHKSVAIPKGEVLADLARIVRDRLAPGKEISYLTFSVEDASFEPTKLKCIGPATYEDGPRKVDAILSELSMGGSKSRVYTDGQGRMVRTELGGQGVLMAQPKELALAPPAKKEDQPDQVLINSLHTTKPIEDAAKLWELKLRFQGEDFSKIPSDEFQTVTRDGDGWIVHIHPPNLIESVPVKIGESVGDKEAWLKPSENLSCNDPAIREAAKKAVGKADTVLDAVFAIRKFVSKRMKAKIEFGDVRDAVDILKNPHGKCVEYAVLTTTLLRAAGVPARIVSGLVTGNGTFLYHAWSEAWDGRRWIGVDAALDMEQMPACYIKLAQGNTDEGLRIVYPNDPSDVKIDVLPLGK